MPIRSRGESRTALGTRVVRFPASVARIDQPRVKLRHGTHPRRRSSDIRRVRRSAYDHQMPKIAAPLTERQAARIAAHGLLADEPDGLLAAWNKVEVFWADTVADSAPSICRSARRPRERRVVIHRDASACINVTDAWIGEVVLEMPSPYDPIGLPPDFFTPDPNSASTSPHTLPSRVSSPCGEIGWPTHTTRSRRPQTMTSTESAHRRRSVHRARRIPERDLRGVGTPLLRRTRSRAHRQCIVPALALLCSGTRLSVSQFG